VVTHEPTLKSRSYKNTRITSINWGWPAHILSIPAEKMAITDIIAWEKHDLQRLVVQLGNIHVHDRWRDVCLNIGQTVRSMDIEYGEHPLGTRWFHDHLHLFSCLETLVQRGWTPDLKTCVLPTSLTEMDFQMTSHISAASHVAAQLALGKLPRLSSIIFADMYVHFFLLSFSFSSLLSLFLDVSMFYLCVLS
jgi:hypothetical protein